MEGFVNVEGANYCQSAAVQGAEAAQFPPPFHRAGNGQFGRGSLCRQAVEFRGREHRHRFEAGDHGDWIGVKCPAMGDPCPCCGWIEKGHDVGPSAECANRKAAANDFAERRQVRRVAEALLRPATLDSKRDDLVRDEQDSIRAGQLAETRQELMQRVHETWPMRQRIDDDRCQLSRVARQTCFECSDIVEWQ